MKLSQWAKEQDISYQTAWNWIKADKFPIPYKQFETGTIIVYPEQENKSALKTYIYCRVSSYTKKADLDRQIERCREFCCSNGWPVEKEIKEIASGMNDKRPKLMKLFSGKPKRIIVEHKDRLTRFGFNYIDLLLGNLCYELVVINKEQENKKDLMQDLISIITSFCCRYYGMRKGKPKAKKIKEQLNEKE